MKNFFCVVILIAIFRTNPVSVSVESEQSLSPKPPNSKFLKKHVDESHFPASQSPSTTHVTSTHMTPAHTSQESHKKVCQTANCSQ